MLDRNGNKIDGKEISLKYRTVEKYSVNIYDKKDYISMFVVRGDNEGKELFEFFAKNTEVEWSRAAMGEKGSFGGSPAKFRVRLSKDFA